MSDVQTIINQKAQDIGVNASKNLGGNKKLSRLIEIESKKIFRNKDVLSTSELVDGLKQKIAEELGIDNNDEIEVACKTIIKTIRQQEKDDPKTVDKFREESLTEEIVEGYKKANQEVKITSDQEKLIREEAEMVAKTYYTGKGIDVETREELLAKDMGVEKEKIPLAFSDLEGTLKFLQKPAGEINDIKGKCETIRNGLSGLNQPNGIREFTSFNSITKALNDGETMNSFGSVQSKFLSVVDRIDTFTGGAVRKVVGDWGSGFVSKLSTGSSKAILENGLKIFAKEGFQTGLNATLQGFLGGGAAAAAGTAGAGAAAGTAIAGGAAAIGATAATGGIAALVFAAKAIFDGIKKIGKKIIDGINNLVANGRGEDEDINKLTKKKWFIPLAILVLLISGCTLQNNQISTMVSPVDEKKVEYAGEYGVSVLQKGNGDFKIPTCDPDGKNPNGNSRLVLRDIALSVVGKIAYSGFNVWHQQGASPLWNTPVPQRWITVKGKDGKPTTILDPVHEAKRRMYPLYGLDCGGIAKWLWYQCMIGNWNKPNIGDWVHIANKENNFGLDEVHLESVDDLKIGDIFERTREESIPACQEIDKKTGKVIKEAGCHHFAIYIGNGDVIEEVGNGGDPALTKIYKVTPEYVLLERDHNAFQYYHTYRITDIFKD